MDKKQVHTIGKMINKPVKFVKRNAGKIFYGVSVIASLVTYHNTKKEK